ncbi:MAG: DUF3435 domain-containing protein [Candidatus Methanomethylophilaceae archaeon]|nr:DUF3435 domain-containing protein [Candidatus Methanomethylophilaceae archaeon]MBR4225569.1 DUF3435 domain-containing protein [Candidatus Methanomethylophilaceae archaeon]
MFPGKNGHDMLHPDSVNTHITRMCKRAGLDHFSPHDFRRTLCTFLNNSQHADAKTIQSLMGHTNLNVLSQHYLKADMDCKRAAINGFVTAVFPVQKMLPPMEASAEPPDDE